MQQRRLGTGGLDVSARLRMHGYQFRLRPRDDTRRRTGVIGAARRTRHHVLRHGRGLWPVPQRRAGRRRAGAGARTGRDCDQVRLQIRRREEEWLDSVPRNQRGRRGIAQAAQDRAIDLFYQHRVDHGGPDRRRPGAVKDLIQRWQGEALRPVRSGSADDSPRACRSAGDGAPERILAVVRANRRHGDAADARGTRASASCRSARSAKGFLTGKIDETTAVRSAPISATIVPRFTPRITVSANLALCRRV